MSEWEARGDRGRPPTRSHYPRERQWRPYNNSMRATAGSSVAQSCGSLMSIIAERAGGDAPDSWVVSVGASTPHHHLSISVHYAPLLALWNSSADGRLFCGCHWRLFKLVQPFLHFFKVQPVCVKK